MKVKQNVFVPAFPGKPVFEEYHGVPVTEYLQEAEKAAKRFAKEYTGKVQFVIKGIANYAVARTTTLYVNRVGEYLVINGYRIKPTKWGTDTVDGGCYPRLWFFDNRTLEDINIECHF